MSVPLLEAIADAIMRYEGWEPHSRSYRNRNPGNLRPHDASELQDAEHYRIFASLVDGYETLLDDLHAKMLPGGADGLGPEATMNKLFEVYAPAADMNQPMRYAEFVAWWVGRVYNDEGITPDVPFKTLFAKVGQEYPRGQLVA